MSFDLAADAKVAEDLAEAAGNPAQAIVAAITLYRCKTALNGVSGLNGMMEVLDKAGLLLPAIDADITLAPALKVLVADPAKKARLFAFIATL